MVCVLTPYQYVLIFCTFEDIKITRLLFVQAKFDCLQNFSVD